VNDFLFAPQIVPASAEETNWYCCFFYDYIAEGSIIRLERNESIPGEASLWIVFRCSAPANWFG